MIFFIANHLYTNVYNESIASDKNFYACSDENMQSSGLTLAKINVHLWDIDDILTCKFHNEDLIVRI